MDASDSLAIDRMVLEAAALDTADRRAYWSEQTVDDPRCLVIAEQRLAAMVSLPSDFLSVPAADLLDDVTAVRAELADGAFAAGSDRYELGELLGRGGMAEVWSAFDRWLRRRVALKIFDREDTRAIGGRDRFLSEARALARVRHDHVIEIYDTGEIEIDGEPRPYLAMTLIADGTLADLPETQPLEARVRLVVQAAEGLHAAHREGLVHRDVKPSNILVESIDGIDKARVTDFGIALAEGRSLAVLAGTPAYLAPEQLDDPTRIDRRVDVWGLGATLYQLICRRLPFDGDSVSTILEQVRTVDPLPCPEGVPRDLAAILDRCLRKDPDARYPSARALADDLRRFLDGDPVEAVTSTWSYRLSKWLVRHRWLALASGLGTVVLTAALAVAAWQGVEAQDANDRAETRRDQAERMVIFMVDDLRDKLAAVGRLDLLEAVGEEVMRYFAAVPEAELSDDEIGRRSRALYQIGEVLIDQGRADNAARSFDQSLDLARRLVERHPNEPGRRFDLAQSEFWVGLAHFRNGDLTRAEAHFDAYRSIAGQLVEAAPTNAEYRLELAYAESNLGSVHQQRGDLSTAETSFRRSLALVQALSTEAGDPPELLVERADGHNLLALALLQDGRLSDAASHLEAEHALRARLAEIRPDYVLDRRYLGTSHDHLADLRLSSGDLEAALEHVERASAIFAALIEHDPTNRTWRWILQVSRATQAKLFRLSGRLDDAETILADLDDAIAEEPDDRTTARLQLMLVMESGQLELARGAWTEARQHLDASVSLAQELLAASPDDAWSVGRSARALLLLGRVDAAAGAVASARGHWAEAEAILERSSARTVESTALRAAVHLALDRPDAACPLITELVAEGFAHPDYPELFSDSGPEAG